MTRIRSQRPELMRGIDAACEPAHRAIRIFVTTGATHEQID
jgi:hypothetical protein